MGDRIVDQDSQQLRHAVGVTGDAQGLLGQPQLELGVVQRQRRDKLRGDRARQHAEVGRCRLEVDRAGLEPRKVEQARRKLAEFLTEPAVVKKLVEQIAPSLKGRSGGYTRITKTRVRNGDAAELSLLELVK